MQTIKLSTTPGIVNPGAYLSQYDVGRQILFLLYDDAGKYVPTTGSTVKIRATKPSGFGFDVQCYWSQNSVTCTITDEMSNEAGSFAAELQITKDSAILGTANFLWNVERAPHPDGTVDGNTEAQNLMSALMEAISDAEGAAAAAMAAAGAAGLSNDIKQALLDCFEHVAWADDDGQDYYDALYNALYPPIPATAITLNRSTLGLHALNEEYTLVATLTPADSTDTVEWTSSDTTIATVDTNGKVKAIAYGSATITATAGNVSATCAVTVAQVTLSSIDATFTQGSATIYTNDSLDDLKQYLVVKAIYSDSSEETLADTDYTLSGTLTAGTSTITATYQTKTDTFNVTVTQYVPHYAIVNNLTHVASSNAGVTSVEENDSYTTSLGVQQGYTMQFVSVTMGGVDITTTVYNSGTGQISIAAVTGNIVITATAIYAPSSISAVFTQGAAIINDTDSLDTLKQYLVVTATYPDSSTATISSTDYTLSGSLIAGISTITASYGGKTDAFTVNVSAHGCELYDYTYNSATSGDDLIDYVDTGLTHTISFAVLNCEFECLNQNTDNTSVALIGANPNPTSGNAGSMLWYARANKGGFSTFNLGAAKQLSTAPGDTRCIVKYYFVDGGESYIQYDSTTVSLGTVSKSSITPNNRTLLLAGGYGTTSNLKYGMRNNAMAKLGYVKFTDPTTNDVVYHFKPAYNTNTQKYGFYDIINKIFYPENSTHLRCGNWT